MIIDWFQALSEVIKFTIIAAIILVVLLLLARWIFGENLKRLNIRVSPREGVGIDIETSLRQLASVQPLPDPILFGTINIGTEDKNDLIKRAISVCYRFNGQNLPVSLFGYDYKYPYQGKAVYFKDESDNFNWFQSLFVLPKFDFVGMISETTGSIVRLYANQSKITGRTFGFSKNFGIENIIWPKIRRMLVICQPIAPLDWDQWVNKVVTLRQSLNKETVLWAIVMEDSGLDHDHYYSLNENLVLLTNKENFESLENIMKISSVAPKVS